MNGSSREKLMNRVKHWRPKINERKSSLLGPQARTAECNKEKSGGILHKSGVKFLNASEESKGGTKLGYLHGRFCTKEFFTGQGNKAG